MMRSVLLAPALATLVACGSNIGDGQAQGPGTDAAEGDPSIDARETGGGGDPMAADAAASPGAHAVGRWCTLSGAPAFFVSVAPEYRADSCFPATAVESAVVVVQTEAPPIGTPIDLSGNESYASYCVPTQGCTQPPVGEITFVSFEIGVSAAGVVNLNNGQYKVPFDASWCLNGTSCE